MSKINSKKPYIICGGCGDLLQSLFLYDYSKCSCGDVYVDGGEGGEMFSRRGVYNIVKPGRKNEHTNTTTNIPT